MDEGYTGENVWAFNWGVLDHIRPEGTWFPEELNVQPDSHCDASLKTQTFNDSTEMKNAMHGEVRASIGGEIGPVEAEFKGNVDVKKMTTDSFGVNKGEAMAKAECLVYRVYTKKDLPPCIAQGIWTRLKESPALSETPTDEEMLDFFKTYGTHAITS